MHIKYYILEIKGTHYLIILFLGFGPGLFFFNLILSVFSSLFEKRSACDSLFA